MKYVYLEKDKERLFVVDEDDDDDALECKLNGNIVESNECC